MKYLTTEEYLLPAHWASYLVNGDASGMETWEVQEVDDWVEAHSAGSCVDVGEPEFTWYGADRLHQYGCDRAQFTFML